MCGGLWECLGWKDLTRHHRGSGFVVGVQREVACRRSNENRCPLPGEHVRNSGLAARIPGGATA